MGYSKNKDIMLRLAKAVELKYLRKFGKDAEFFHKAEALFFHVSGLLELTHKEQSEETSGYIRSLHEQWLEIEDTYDGPTFSSEEWSFYRMRPQNYPPVRLAGGVAMLNEILNHNLIGGLNRIFIDIHNVNTLKACIRSIFVTKGHGYWSRHYMFDTEAKPYINFFVGKNRADEMVIGRCTTNSLHLLVNCSGNTNLHQNAKT